MLFGRTDPDSRNLKFFGFLPDFQNGAVRTLRLWTGSSAFRVHEHTFGVTGVGSKCQHGELCESELQTLEGQPDWR